MPLPTINLQPLTAARPEEILRPPKPWFVFLTLVIAMLLNLLPWSGVGLALKPDFLALVLLYWCIQQPRLVGVGTAWFCGLLADVGQGSLFGQHALAYALLGFAAEYFHRRVLRFPLWQQAAHVAVLLLLCLLLVLVVRMVGGAAPLEWSNFLGAISGALLWPLTSVILQWPQRPSSSSGDR
ncbi:MAG: rod shape-determining protein MreD [Betaproteobacteria bacterium]